MIPIENFWKISKGAYKTYVGVGIFSMGLLALCVIFTVIMRYIFSLSWKSLEEFMTTLFAFTTFWGLGICILENEHVVIDILYDSIPKAIKRWVTVFNYIIVLIVDAIFFFYSYKYVMAAGNQISQGMEIPMKYMYGIMPVCTAVCAFCIIIKILEIIKAPIEYFAPKNKEITG